MTKRISPELEERLSLYLDGRLESPEREEFERLMQSDAGLREALEFHHGLARALREEQPPLPADYASGARRRLEGARAEASPSTPRWWRRPAIPLAAGVAAAILAAILTPQLIRRRPAGRVAAPPPPETTPVIAEADKQTLEALRSLGYIGSGDADQTPPKGTPAPAREPPLKAAPATRAPARAPAARARTAEGSAFNGVLQEQREASPQGLRPSVVAPSPRPAEGAGVASRVEGEARGSVGELPFRIVPLSRGPDSGSDHREIRSVAEWDAFVAPPASPGGAAGLPGVAFDQGEMMIVLRASLEGEPPTRLRVVAVRVSGGELTVECRAEPRGVPVPGVVERPGQGVVVAGPPLPVRVVIR
jgi:hypothetical protein